MLIGIILRVSCILFHTMKFKAVIFDMDGLLIDNEYHWDQTSVGLLGRRGITLTPELKKQLSGQSLRRNMEWFKSVYEWPESVEILMDEFRSATDHIYRYTTQPMPGARELLKTIGGGAYKQAVASGSSLDRIECIVDRFDWRQFFQALISTDHVDFAGKPDPAIYLHTARVLAAEPQDCVVVEDSHNGLRSAKAAGMSCIMVPDRRWSYGDFAEADLIAESLSDAKLLKFLGL